MDKQVAQGANPATHAQAVEHGPADEARGADRPCCAWVTDEELRAYHDDEWGQRPESDARWFEFIVLETFQAGLSWRTILRKRDAFRSAFAGFQVERVAAFDSADLTRLLSDAAIVRNRQKILATLENAKIAQRIIEQEGSLGAFLTRSTGDDLLRQLQSTFRFVGRTTAESIAYATGLIPPPHDADCWKTDASADRAVDADRPPSRSTTV